MNNEGSYIAEEEGKDLGSELNRLEQQGKLGWDKELELLRQNGLVDGIKVLDAGCGSGVITLQLLQLFRNMEITALDSDVLMLQRTKEKMSFYPHSQSKTALGSVYNPPFEKSSFDYILLRYVLQHLKDPLLGLQRLKNTLRTDGQIAITDIDAGLWGIVDPITSGLDQIYQQYAKLQAQRGGDRLIGRKLHRLLEEAGFREIKTYLFSYSSDEYGLTPFLSQIHPERYLPLLKNNMIDLNKYAQLISAYETFIQNPKSQIIMTGFMAFGKR